MTPRTHKCCSRCSCRRCCSCSCRRCYHRRHHHFCCCCCRRHCSCRCCCSRRHTHCCCRRHLMLRLLPPRCCCCYCRRCSSYPPTWRDLARFPIIQMAPSSSPPPLPATHLATSPLPILGPLNDPRQVQHLKLGATVPHDTRDTRERGELIGSHLHIGVCVGGGHVSMVNSQAATHTLEGGVGGMASSQAATYTGGGEAAPMGGGRGGMGAPLTPFIIPACPLPSEKVPASLAMSASPPSPPPSCQPPHLREGAGELSHERGLADRREAHESDAGISHLGHVKT